MILGYKRPIADSPAYWYGNIGDEDRQFIRVMAGISLPILDRTSGAVVVVGEIFNKHNPIDLWILGAGVGPWTDVKASILQFRRDLMFDRYVTDVEEARMIIRNDREISFGEPMLTSADPLDWAQTEVGRDKAAQLRLEGRLHLDDDMEQTLDWDPDPAHFAIQSVVCWLAHYPAIYDVSQPPPGFGRILGVDGL